MSTDKSIMIPKWKEDVKISPPSWAESVNVEPHPLGGGYNSWQFWGRPASQDITDTPTGHELHAVLAHIHHEGLGAHPNKLAGYDRAACIIEFKEYGKPGESHSYAGFLNGSPTRVNATIRWWPVPDYRSEWPLHVLKVCTTGHGEWAYDSERHLIWPWGKYGAYTKRTKAKKVIQFSELTA